MSAAVRVGVKADKQSGQAENRMQPSPLMIIRLEKLARDNGFDLREGQAGGWLAFASTQTRMRIWLSAQGEDFLLLAVSRRDVKTALLELGVAFVNPLPEGAQGALSVIGLEALHGLTRRAFQLARSLPDEPLQQFRLKTASLPQTTEVERLVVQRVGQEIFRQGLLDYWEGRCALTGLALPELLRASHIKPWAACASDDERLDSFNGLLLAPHLDAVFDRGLMTLDPEGRAVFSPHLTLDAQACLGFPQPLRIKRLTPRHHTYLHYHREKVFRGG